MTFDNDFYKKVCPDIILPEYDQCDIDKELLNLCNENIKIKKEFFRDFCSGLLIGTLIGLFSSFFLNLNISNLPAIFIVTSFCALFTTIIVIARNISLGNYITLRFKPVNKEIAEFNLRLRLCKEQFSLYRKSGDDLRFNQLWSYCNSALSTPFTL